MRPCVIKVPEGFFPTAGDNTFPLGGRQKGSNVKAPHQGDLYACMRRAIDESGFPPDMVSGLCAVAETFKFGGQNPSP